MKFKEMQTIVENSGFKLARISSSHYIYKHMITKKLFVLPRHGEITAVRSYLAQIKRAQIHDSI